MLCTFSVWDEEVAHEVSTRLGKRVAVHYLEHRGIPTNCLGETAHYVDHISDVPEQMD